MAEQIRLMEPGTAVLPSSKPLSFRQRNAIHTILYGLALCILISMAWPIYIFLAFGGFDTVDSANAFTALVKNLLVIGFYFSMTLGCAYGLIKHAWRLLKGAPSRIKYQQGTTGLLQSAFDDDNASTLPI